MGRVEGYEVYAASKCKIIPVPATKVHLSEAQAQEEEIFLEMLESLFRSGGIFICYGWDLTNSLQRQSSLKQGNQGYSWEKADQRFFWNFHAVRPFIDHGERHPDQNLGNFILPLMHGCRLHVNSQHSYISSL